MNTRSETASPSLRSTQCISLDGAWRFRSSDGAPDAAMLAEASDASSVERWLSGAVPGRVHADLLRLGRIPDPRVATNSRDCTWVDDQDWWYSRQFVVARPSEPVQRALLVFEGLDTVATAYLNGQLVGSHADMYVPCTFDVTDVLAYDRPNTLTVKLASVRKTYGERDARGVVPQDRAPAFFSRHYHTSFGAYLGAPPYLIGAGIWRSVALVLVHGVRLSDVFVQAALRPAGTGPTPAEVEASVEAADLAIQVTLQNDAAEPRDVTLEIAADGRSLWRGEIGAVEPGERVLTLSCSLAKPRLWWPHTLGQPNLYDFQVTTRDSLGHVDVWRRPLGIRSVELVLRSHDGPGGPHRATKTMVPSPAPTHGHTDTVSEGPDGEDRFYFRVNGVPVFLKGAGWVPPDGLTLNAPVAVYRQLLTMARDANMNLVRDWAGGVVERREFFEICDELGIVVWMDFMLEAKMQPDWDQEFVEQVRAECAAVVRQLRNHACVWLWCGGNEMFMGWDMWNWRAHAVRLYGASICLDLLPKLCAALDPTRPYWPNSPYGGAFANSPEVGDIHDYSWNDFMSIDDARFVSEIGRIAPPVLKSVRKAIPPKDLWPIGDVWRHYNGQLPNGRVRGTDEYGPITSVDEYVRCTQLGQAEYLEERALHFRRRKFRCGGFMIWRLNDPWLTSGMAVIDVNREPKMGYYFLKRAYADPVAFVVRVPQAGAAGSWVVWGVTDRPETIHAQLEISHFRYAGDLLWTRRQAVRLEGNSATPLATIPWAELPPAVPNIGRCLECLAVRLWIDGQPTRWMVHHFAHWALQRLAPGQLEADPGEANPGGGSLVFRARSFVELVELSAEADVAFEDNYFDVLPGETKWVRWRRLAGADEQPVPLRFGIRARNVEERWLSIG